jgi:uncharacterized protein
MTPLGSRQLSLTQARRGHSRHWLASSLAALWIGLMAATPVLAGALSDAASPYLRSHADDRIEWHPWDEDALARARTHDKLIFLSIGYASCHWCHVMTRTTFADDRVIATLKDDFVSILVDREERPDLDGHFMEFMRATTGYSGYPANFILTPDAIPIYAVGYLAADPEFGKPGFVDVTRALAKEWAINRQRLMTDAGSIRDQLRALAEPSPRGAAQNGKDPRDSAARSWLQAFDITYGGFGREPKFLKPVVLSFLLRQSLRNDDRRLLENVFRTLDHMSAGGIRDQLGGAFHRYAVDRFWQVPHFEIMLDDNAAMALLYLEAYQASGESRYAAVARSILDDLVARFRLPAGGFATSLDSDSEGVEGRYYTWAADEVRAVLGASAAAPFIAAYVDPSHGLVQGRSVLRLLGAPASLLKTEIRFAESRSLLRKTREDRTPPRRDDKVLTSWNALTISAFAKAAQVFDNEGYRRLAREEMGRLLEPFTKTGSVVHSRWRGKASETVFLDDYAYLAQALLDLYEADFEADYLDQALALMEVMFERFQGAPGTAFRFTPEDRSSPLPARIVLGEENVPSGNATALVALQRLSLFGAAEKYRKRARAIIDGLAGYLHSSAPSSPGLMQVLDFSPDEAREIVIVGRLGGEDTRRLLGEVRKRLLPGTVLAVISPNAPEVNDRWPLLDRRPLLGDKATAYVCRNRLCDVPVDTPEEFAAQLDRLIVRARAAQ